MPTVQRVANRVVKGKEYNKYIVVVPPSQAKGLVGQEVSITLKKKR